MMPALAYGRVPADPQAYVPASGRRTKSSLDRLAWGAVIVLLLAQRGLFRQFALREVVGSYPPYFDQLAYLEQSYETYQRILDHGVITGLGEGMGLKFGHLPMNAGGATLHLEAALLYLMTGPSRLSAISLNFIYFAVFQIVLVAAVRWLTGRWSAAFLALGLLLTTMTGFYFAGGLFDFRFDFGAFCFFGIFICAVVRSGIFDDWRWSVVAGAAAVVLGTHRLITLVYLFGIFGLFLGFLVAFWFVRWNDLPGQQRIQRRVRGTLVAGLIIAFLAGPVLWHHRQAIYGYYIAGHLEKGEKELRARETNTTTFLASIAFYPMHLKDDHLGPVFLVVVYWTLILALLVGIVTAASRLPGTRRPAVPIDFICGYVFLGLCLMVPLAVLTADTAKGQQVAGIMVAPILWLVILAVVMLLEAYRGEPMPAAARYLLHVLATVAMLAGLWVQFTQYTRRTIVSQNPRDVADLVGMYDRMFDDCQAMGWTSPAIAVDCTSDFLYHKNLTILGYERHGVLLSAGGSIGQLQAYPVAELFERMRRSDFAVITRLAGPAPEYQFPFDLQLQELHPQILAWCRQNMTELRRLHVFDRDIDVFIRPSVKMQAAADGWITSDGLTVTGLAAVLRQRPVIEMRGQANFQYLGRVPHVTAALLREGGQIPVPADITASGSSYLITVRLNPGDVPVAGTAEVHIAFDAHFVPREIGANADTRALVMPLPSEAVLKVSS